MCWSPPGPGTVESTSWFGVLARPNGLAPGTVRVVGLHVRPRPRSWSIPWIPFRVVGLASCRQDANPSFVLANWRSRDLGCLSLAASAPLPDPVVGRELLRVSFRLVASLFLPLSPSSRHWPQFSPSISHWLVV